jgi:hypothetical protein
VKQEDVERAIQFTAVTSERGFCEEAKSIRTFLHQLDKSAGFPRKYVYKALAGAVTKILKARGCV